MQEVKFRILESAYNKIKETSGTLPPETGGLLVGDLESFTITDYIFDETGKGSRGAYDPDVYTLSQKLEEVEKRGIRLLGMQHSHPLGCERLSSDYGDNIGDLGYIKGFFDVNPHLDRFHVPIVCSLSDGEFKFLPYIAFRDDVENYQTAELEIIPDEQFFSENEPRKPSSRIELPFEKTQGAVDLEIIENAKVVVIGIGGANYICDYLVRTGIREIHAVDFDTVSESNLVTQGYFVDDIGKLKVEALGERLKRINPGVKYTGYDKNFLKMTNREIRRLMKGADLLLMMTDDFHAQAFGNRISLSLQIPTIFAMMYERGRGSEVSINLPGITPGCHRCATEERYQAYEAGYENDITSTGSTMVHTQSLNIPISFLSLAILHRSSKDTELGNWFEKTWDRNFIQIRTHPEFGMETDGFFRRTFEGQPRVFALDSVWQKVSPAYSNDPDLVCPDCGGTGDLRDAAGIQFRENTKL